MSNHHPHRVQSGVSEGGQFATGARPESDVALAVPPPVTPGVEHEDLGTFTVEGAGGLLGYHGPDGQVWLTDEAMPRIASATVRRSATNFDAPTLRQDAESGAWVTMDANGQVAPAIEGRGRGNERIWRIEGLEVEEEDPWDGTDVQEKVEQCLDAYLGAAKWSTPNHQDSSTPNYAAFDHDFDEDAKQLAREELAGFIDNNQALIRAASSTRPIYGVAEVAHDFWLTRNHHGAGFWDRGLGDVGDRLRDAAHAEGALDVELGDDGKVHFL